MREASNREALVPTALPRRWRIETCQSEVVSHHHLADADAEEKVGKGEEKKKENAKDDGRADQAAK